MDSITGSGSTEQQLKKNTVLINKYIEVNTLDKISESNLLKIVRNIFNYDLKTSIKLLSIMSAYNPYRIGYSVLNITLLNKMKKYEPILEVGSGYGLNSKLLKLSGIKIKATDQSINKHTFISVEQLDSIKAVEKYMNHTLFICWPSYNSPFAYTTLKKYNGSIFIYLGETRDGACANDSFFDLLDAEWIEIYVKDHKWFAEILMGTKFKSHYQNSFIIYKKK